MDLFDGKEINHPKSPLREPLITSINMSSQSLQGEGGYQEALVMKKSAHRKRYLVLVMLCIALMSR